MKRFCLTNPIAVLLLILLFLLIGKQGFSQETQNSEIKLTDRTVNLNSVMQPGELIITSVQGLHMLKALV